MKWLDAVLGRTRQKPADLDALFALPAATITLEASVGLRPSGQAAVCFKPASGQGFAETAGELQDLLRFSAEQSGTKLATEEDRFGYRWVVLSDSDFEDLVGTAHLVNNTLEGRGFGPQLLCSVFGFGGDPGACHLVYLYKRGTFYPFAPRAGEHRDNELELRVRGALGSDLPVEEDLSRWFPLWGLPIS